MQVFGSYCKLLEAKMTWFAVTAQSKDHNTSVYLMTLIFISAELLKIGQGNQFAYGKV